MREREGGQIDLGERVGGRDRWREERKRGRGNRWVERECMFVRVKKCMCVCVCGRKAYDCVTEDRHLSPCRCVCASAPPHHPHLITCPPRASPRVSSSTESARLHRVCWRRSREATSAPEAMVHCCARAQREGSARREEGGKKELLRKGWYSQCCPNQSPWQKHHPLPLLPASHRPCPPHSACLSLFSRRHPCPSAAAGHTRRTRSDHNSKAASRICTISHSSPPHFCAPPCLPAFPALPSCGVLLPKPKSASCTNGPHREAFHPHTAASWLPSFAGTPVASAEHDLGLGAMSCTAKRVAAGWACPACAAAAAAAAASPTAAPLATA